VADLANQHLKLRLPTAAHPLDDVSETAPTPSDNPPALVSQSEYLPAPSPGPLQQGLPIPLKQWDVYVDDFIGMVQGGAAHRRHVKRALLATLDTVFRRLAPGDNPFRQEPASVKKMQKGDATWATRKVLRGWLVDTLKMIIELPPHRVRRLFQILDSVPPHQGRTSVRKWQKLLGELRSMVLAVPGGNGMFSILQSVLSKRCDSTSRLRLTKPVHAILKDFRLLAQDLATRPTRLAVLVPADRPSTLGAHDAAASGMGGIHFFPMGDGSVDPILWRSRFPPLLPPGWSRPTTQLETLPIASSSWR
jgi:hypothetical protein